MIIRNDTSENPSIRYYIKKSSSSRFNVQTHTIAELAPCGSYNSKLGVQSTHFLKYRPGPSPNIVAPPLDCLNQSKGVHSSETPVGGFDLVGDAY